MIFGGGESATRSLGAVAIGWSVRFVVQVCLVLLEASNSEGWSGRVVGESGETSDGGVCPYHAEVWCGIAAPSVLSEEVVLIGEGGLRWTLEFAEAGATVSYQHHNILKSSWIVSKFRPEPVADTNRSCAKFGDDPGIIDLVATAESSAARRQPAASTPAAHVDGLSPKLLRRMRKAWNVAWKCF